MSELQNSQHIPEKPIAQPAPHFEIVKPSVQFESSTEVKDGRSGEELIVYYARVSNPNNQDNPKITNLIKYCLDQGHWSIFEMVDMVVKIETSRDISAQIIRHKSFNFQEMSQRYAEVSEFMPIEARLQDKKNRQNSIDLDKENLEQKQLETWLQEQYIRVLSISIASYQDALNRGIAKEVARKLLPINAKTTIYMKGSIRSWIHYLQVRTKPDTQKEHREIAEGVKTIFIKKYPIISKALDWN